MRKLPKKKIVHSKTKSHHSAAASRRSAKRKFTRGNLGAGTAYAILGLLVIMAAGSLMIGSIVPKGLSPENGQTVIISTNTPEPQKSDLQLYTFPGATFTPTPSPTLPPQPQNNWQSGNSNNGSNGNGNGPGSCFPAGTKIAMADGTQKNIEDVKVGDEVIGFDGQKQVTETVLQTEAPVSDSLYQLTFASGLVLKLTANHALFTNNGWESIDPTQTTKENPNLIVGKLRAGDGVLNNLNSYDTLLAITYVPGKVQTYNLKIVTGFNNYFAGALVNGKYIGLEAHNKGSCFIAGTKVLLENGSEKNIEDVIVGDKVMGYDTLNSKLAPETVLAVESPIRDHYYNLTLSDGSTLGLTREHPLYTPNGWESINPASTLDENPKLVVGTLHIGDSVLKDNGNYATVVSMDYIPGTVHTYNLKSVSGYNDFFANGDLAHNKGAGPGNGNNSGGSNSQAGPTAR